MSRKYLHTTLLAGLVAFLAGSATFALPAEARKRARRAEATRPAKAAPKTTTRTSEKTPENAEESSAAASADSAAPAEARPAAASAPPKARVYTFSGLDVNGNLKAPQLLFFRGRVKQELDTSNPEKRSFLKELERTADAKGL